MEKLWLARFKLVRCEYMVGLKRDLEYTFRLVKGENEEEVEKKIKDSYEYGSHGGDTRTVVEFEAHQCIN